jgi:hypothetical protein
MTCNLHELAKISTINFEKILMKKVSKKKIDHECEDAEMK